MYLFSVLALKNIGRGRLSYLPAVCRAYLLTNGLTDIKVLRTD
jgi:hypothetical protein